MVTTMSGITVASGPMTTESILSTDINVLLLFIIAIQNSTAICFNKGCSKWKLI